MKRAVSLLLSVVMVFSTIGAVDFSANAEENDETAFASALLKENIQYFKSYFLSDLDPTKQAFYIDYLTEADHENDETSMQILEDSVNRVQSKWSQILNYMPESITSSQIVSMGNQAFSYLNGTIETFKYIQYIKDEDTRITQKCYHGLHAVNTALSVIGINLGPIGIALQILEKFFIFSDLMYVTFMDELVQIQVNNYAQDLYIDYWTGGEFRVPSKDDVSALNWSDEWVENYYEGAYEQYLLYSLKRMANNAKKTTEINPVNEKCYFGGHTYQVYQNRMNWSTAKQYCEKIGGHLVTIQCREENDFIKEIILSTNKGAMIGLSDVETEGIFQWVTNEDFVYSNWKSGEPNNQLDEDYVLINTDGTWNDGHLDEENWDFVCEWDYYIDPYPTINDEHHYVQTVVAPTCTTDGYTINQCSDCELQYYSNNVPKLGHIYEFSKNVSATCTASGYDLYTCSRCGTTEQRNIVNALGHNYVFQSTTDVACESQGYDTYKCSRCGTTEKRNVVEATGHNYTVANTIPATCTEAGLKTEICSNCGDVQETEIAALGHSYIKTYIRANCTENGYTINTCSRCKDTYNDRIIEAAGHDYGDCIGDEYLNTIYGADGKFVESPNGPGSNGKYICVSSCIGSTSQSNAVVCVMPQQIRVDVNNINDITKYKFWLKKRANFFPGRTCDGMFSYDINTGRAPEQSAIPYADKDGNLINMKYVDYLTENGWICGKYSYSNGILTDENGTIVTDTFTQTRPHIVYTKEYAEENGILNSDGTVNVTMEICREISFSAGVDGVYFIAEAYQPTNLTGKYVDTFGYDSSKKPSAGVYKVNVCFYNSSLCGTGEFNIKIYNKDELKQSTPATVNSDEMIKYTCIDCGETHTDTFSLDLQNFKIKTVSLSLESNITMNYKVLKSSVESFDNLYIEFTRNGKTTIVRDFTEQGDYYVFAYKDIPPQAMNDTVTAVLKGTHNSIEYSSSPLEFSVSKYAYGMLEMCSSNQYAKLRTLLVDLLNYGSAAQTYQNYNIENLVNSKLTDEQKSWASDEDLNLTNVTDTAFTTVDNPTVIWKSVGLQLNESVAVRYKFSAESIDSVKLKVTCGENEWIYTSEDFTSESDGTYTLLFNELNADKMQEDIYITAYSDDSQISNTMRYSVESYAKQVENVMPNSNLRRLTDAMMRYGISASNYS